MEFIVTLFVVLFLSYILSLAFVRLGLPKLLAPILLGALFTLGNLKTFFFSGSSLSILNFIKDLAIIFLMFFVGLKIDLRHFQKSSKKSIYIALMASVIPFIFGFISVQLGFRLGMLANFFPEPRNLFIISYVVGLCMSVTAEVVAIEVLEELNILKSFIGETIIEAGLVDSIIGVLMLGGLIAFIPSEATEQFSISFKIFLRFFEMIVFAIVIYLLGKYAVPSIMKQTESLKQRNINFFTISIIIALFLGVISILLDFGGSILGALFSGMIIRHTLLAGDKIERKEETHLSDIIEITTFGFFAPFFFFWIGLNTDFYVLVHNPLLAVIIIGLAVVGKFLGTIIGNKLGGGKLREGYIISWGMNTKGEVDIMIATLMFTLGILTKDLFSSLVIMSFVVTLISPIMFKLLVKHYHGI